MDSYGAHMFTTAVQAEQDKAGTREKYARVYETRLRGPMDADVRAFLESRTSLYIASVSETGWPYVQHRGGPAGFVKILSEDRIGFADYKGNKQFITTGNLAKSDRVSLFAMDYVRKARLKLIGHATMIPAAEDPALAAQLATEGQGPVERLMTIRIVALDWNCPQYITPRFDTEELTALVGPELSKLETRIAELEAENAALRTEQERD
jgi:predicted pyridoxine 5'-phosphate oxidase superfamily flavin-nucleotide-binding protein